MSDHLDHRLRRAATTLRVIGLLLLAGSMVAWAKVGFEIFDAPEPVNFGGPLGTGFVEPSGRLDRFVSWWRFSAPLAVAPILAWIGATALDGLRPARTESKPAP